jgi:serine/threonine protein kinase
MVPEIAQPVQAQSLWTGPRDDPRRYRIDVVDGVLANIGDGGEGLVFRATAQIDGRERDVALKMHTSLTLEDFDRFSQRAQALSEVDSPDVMHLIEVFVGAGLFDGDDPLLDDAFNVMYTAADWIPGLSLPAALEATDSASGMRWVSETARATAYLHGFRSPHAPEGLVHRDIKPSNVRITTDDRAVLIDFGIARPHQKGDLTEGAGTYLWRAPEVVGGPGEPGPASDAWGIGAMAYWVLMGEPPRLEGAEPARKLLAPAALQAGFVDPHGLSESISELLETHPKDRPADLSRWADEFDLAVAGKRRRRVRGRSVVVAVVAVVALIAGLVGVLLQGGSPASSATKTASFTFRPEAFESGLIVDRTWTLSGARGDHLEGSATLLNGNPGALATSYDEVLPTSVASSVNRVSFHPNDEQVVQRDPVVRYSVTLSGGGSERIGFSVDIGPAESAWSKRLGSLARAQEAAETSFLAATNQPAPVSLASLQISPSNLAVDAGQSKPVTLAGTMSNGTAANQAELAGVAWSSSASTVASVTNGIIFGLTAGSATITAHAGSASASLAVVVTATAGQSSPSGGSADAPDTSRSSSPSSSPSQSPSSTGASGVTQTTSSGSGVITSSTTSTTTLALPLPTTTTTLPSIPTLSSKTITVFGPWTNTGLLITPTNSVDDSFLFGETISNISEICVDFSYFEGMPPEGGMLWMISGLGGEAFFNTGTTTITSDSTSCMTPENQGSSWASIVASLANGHGDLDIYWANEGRVIPPDDSYELSGGTMTITGSFG